jgi:hypothetical protein
MYMPKLARDAAEHRLGAADFTAAGRERAVVDAVARILKGFAQLPRRLYPARSAETQRCDAGTNG